MKIIRTLWIGLFLLGLAGCSLELSITPVHSLLPDSSRVMTKSKVGEFVSGGTQYEETPLRRYRVTSSVGSINKELVVKSPRGYKIYSSVQGAIISEDGQH